MSQSDWDEQFDLFAINNFHERENAEGTGYDVSLEVKRITSGTTIANRPYVIRPKSYSEENPTMTIDMTDATLKPKQKYVLVTDDYITTGGDGYSPDFFPEKQAIEVPQLPTTTDAFINYLRTQETI